MAAVVHLFIWGEKQLVERAMLFLPWQVPLGRQHTFPRGWASRGSQECLF